ncbi:MAG: HIT domain-containing protein [Clostridia bacterium]
MKDCIFCKIASGEIPSTKIVDEEKFFIIKDIHPKALKHFLLITKEHYALLENQSEKQASEFGEILASIHKYEKILGIENGFSLRINQKAGGGQEIAHLHVHILADY